MTAPNLASGNNALTVKNEIDWLNGYIESRLVNYFDEAYEFVAVPPPSLVDDQSKYAHFIKKYQLNAIERLIIAVCIANYFKPQVFDKFLIKNKALDKRFTEFGGKIEGSNSIFVPTLETIAFIFYGDNFESRFTLHGLFDKNHIFRKLDVIQFKKDTDDFSFLSNTPYLTEEFIQLFTLGKSFKPNYSSNFPASLIETPLNWDDLILNTVTVDEVLIVNTWIEKKVEIDTNQILNKKINTGYKCLFFGPPGTGKTLTASLIGKKNNKDVYRIDLSEVVSKYIGETEKNLARIFDIAENRDWILFFDEAESLFSKRTGVQDSKDKYANQQTAYMLQRIENYNGLIILATNLKPNIDMAFSRRIQSVINFPLPNAQDRQKLWEKALGDISEVSEAFIRKISSGYELSGGVIKNVIQYAWLIAQQHDSPISENHILAGIRRELKKDGKYFGD